MDNTLNILVEAKKEYTEQLCLLIGPAAIEVFENMFIEAQKLSKNRKTLLKYQELLKDVQNWNEGLCNQHTRNICDRCAWFNDLLAAVFVSSVKILSAVRLNSTNKKISIKMPTNDLFLHTCYKNIAKDLYKDPYVFTHNLSLNERNDKLYQRICTQIDVSIKELIPVQQILKTYMFQNESESIDLSGDVDDTEDPEIEDDTQEVPTEEQPQEDDITNDSYEDLLPNTEPTEEVKSEPVEDVKNIDLEKNGSDDLFPDAAETRSVKNYKY